jgi:hypothetical protein
MTLENGQLTLCVCPEPSEVARGRFFFVTRFGAFSPSSTQPRQLLPERLETLGGGVPRLSRTFGKFSRDPVHCKPS